MEPPQPLLTANDSAPQKPEEERKFNLNKVDFSNMAQAPTKGTANDASDEEWGE